MRELHFMRMHGQGFVLVYSVTALSTFNEIPHFVDQILNYRDGQNAPMVLVGNKVDLQHQRVVTPNQGEQLARQLNCPYFETSAMTKHNVDAIFYDLVRQIINVRMKARQTRPGPASNRRLCIIL
jgi:small GTP-binding protein